MNFFDDIITYITARVQSVDANLSFYENDVFGEEDPSDFFADQFFKCWFGPTTQEKDGSELVESMTMTLQIYSLTAIGSDREFRDAYCKALDIKDAITYPQDNASQAFWTEIQFDSVTPDPLPTDDNTAVFTLVFTIRRDREFD